MAEAETGDPDGPAQEKLVKVVHKDFTAESERDHFDKQLVRRPWSRG